MGFGHRVYKNFDPRAMVMKEQCHAVLNELGITNDPTLDVAMELERIALEDEYFVSKNLYPNIDFYSGITLRALGFKGVPVMAGPSYVFSTSCLQPGQPWPLYGPM